MLRDEGIEFQVYRNPDVKWLIVECAHSTIRGKQIKYFTYNIAFRYIDGLPKFVRAYKYEMTRFTRRPAWRPSE